MSSTVPVLPILLAEVKRKSNEVFFSCRMMCSAPITLRR
jgi:hypothetical protein